jgi:hypothetical protein
MNNQLVIMVQVNEPKWMQSALNSAGALAHKSGGRVVLVKMVRVQHLSELSRPLACSQLDSQEQRALHAYAATLVDSGIECDLEIFHYWDMFGAIAEAARELGAKIVFAKLPPSKIPFWAASRFEVLRQHMAHCGQQLLDGAQNEEGAGDNSAHCTAAYASAV